jgi:hypothetical protein
MCVLPEDVRPSWLVTPWEWEEDRQEPEQEETDTTGWK